MLECAEAVKEFLKQRDPVILQALKEPIKTVLGVRVEDLQSDGRGLQLIAGGNGDGTVWSDSFKSGGDILEHFKLTLDTCNTGPIDKALNGLKKVHVMIVSASILCPNAAAIFILITS